MKHYEVWVRDEDVNMLDWCEKKEIPEGAARVTRDMMEGLLLLWAAQFLEGNEILGTFVTAKLDEMFGANDEIHSKSDDALSKGDGDA